MATRAKPALPGSDLPFARITKTGKLSCTGCRKRTEPRLIEPETALGAPIALLADKLAGVQEPAMKKTKRAFLFG